MSARVKKILMERDDLTSEEADLQIAAFEIDMEQVINDHAGAFSLSNELDKLMEDHFGLEPDYLDDFLY